MRLSHTCSLLATALLCAFSAPALSSGGDGFQRNPFASQFQPAHLPNFAGGKLGVVPGSYWRIYHYLAYQAAKGKPLTEQQLDTLSLNTWHVGEGNEWNDIFDAEKNGSGVWLKERAVFAKQWGLPADIKLAITGETSESETFVNCNADAFKQASATMKARARLGAGGKPDAWHKQWLLGQDAVFSNCEEAPDAAAKRVAHLPPALPKLAPEWLQYDHAYQNAAANFYARNFDLARAQFQDIAKQAKSPWQPLGAYLAARSLIRKATLDYPLKAATPAPERMAALALAKKELDALAPAYAPARQMVSLVEARLDPTERIAAIARILDKEPFSAATPRLLSDYLILLDQQPQGKTIEAKEPLTAWIGNMQAETLADPWGDPASKQLQVQRVLAMATLRKAWLKQADPLWLAPLVSLAKGGELSAAEKKAAAGVAASHPLYQTVQYHLARLAIAEKQLERADKNIHALLAAQGKTMSVATTNRFKALQMVTAPNVDAYLKAALRAPDPVDSGAEIDAPPAPATQTDADFGQSVLRFMSLAELKALLKHPALPAEWKTRLQETTFARALILNDEASALELLDTLAKGRKTTAHLYARYRTAQPGPARRLAGTLILVNTPELNPAVMNKRGGAQFWGCATGAENPAAGEPAAPRFLSVERLAEAEKEQEILRRLPLRSEYLAPALLEWAGKKQADEEAPKGLHFLIASTRMECPYGTAKPEKEQLRARYSRQAFDMLHKLYPSSDWAKATKYFF
jgi:hypothetical protein